MDCFWIYEVVVDNVELLEVVVDNMELLEVVVDIADLTQELMVVEMLSQLDSDPGPLKPSGSPHPLHHPVQGSKARSYSHSIVAEVLSYSSR